MGLLAAAAKYLGTLPYVDAKRIGIFGTSYGGYAAALAILRYPDLFAAASAQSAVTSWHHYDTIYTERYMYTPQENEAGYKKGSAMEYAANLKGRLMIYYGTADDNVHPNNAMQLIRALQRAGKSFEVQVGPDAGHSALVCAHGGPADRPGDAPPGPAGAGGTHSEHGRPRPVRRLDTRVLRRDGDGQSHDGGAH